MAKNKNKMQPKAQHEIKERQLWEFNPVQRVLPNKKAYNRKKENRVDMREYA